MFIRTRLTAELSTLNTILQGIDAISKSHPLHRTLRIALVSLRSDFEDLQKEPALEAHPEALDACIEAACEYFPPLVGDDQKPLTLGAYVGSDGKIYSTETIYHHLCSAAQRDCSPLLGTTPWSIKKHDAISTLLRFYERHQRPLNPEPNTDFFDNLGMQVPQEDLSTLLPAALHQTLQTELEALQRKALDTAVRTNQDDLSQTLIEWTTSFLQTLSVLRDKQGVLNDPKVVLNALGLQDESVTGKLDEWFILDYFHDHLLNFILIDPVTQFPLDPSAQIINDQRQKTVNQTTLDRLLTSFPDLKHKPHPALSDFLAWAKHHDCHLKPMHTYHRHRAEKVRSQKTAAFRNAQRQTLVDALQTPVQQALASARQALNEKLNGIQAEIDATDEGIKQLAVHTQQTDKSIQQLQADMNECNQLWQTLLNDLLPRQDAAIQQGILDLQKIQQQAQVIQVKAVAIQQALATRIEVLNEKDARLKQAVADLGTKVDTVARQQVETALRIVQFERDIAQSKNRFFGELLMGVGFILGACVGAGVAAVMLQASMATHTATLAGLATSVAITGFFGMAQGKNSGEYGEQYRYKKEPEHRNAVVHRPTSLDPADKPALLHK